MGGTFGAAIGRLAPAVQFPDSAPRRSKEVKYFFVCCFRAEKKAGRLEKAHF